MHYYEVSSKEVIRYLGSSFKGLKETEANVRLNKYGYNVIKKGVTRRKISIFIGQFKSLLMYILFLSSVVSAIIGHYIDSGVILIMALINGTIGFLQEYKAEEIIEKLRSSLRYEIRVIRDGKQREIDSKYLVPGDIIFLETGDKVPADARIIKQDGLTINEAILSGESFPVEKISEALNGKTVITDRKNMLYAGTIVVYGKAMAIVVATAENSEFGKLAELVQKTTSSKTPLEIKLDDFSKKSSIVIFGLVFVTFLIGIALGYSRSEMFLTSVSLAVGAIPEGLPVIIIITLAMAIRKMYSVNTLVRKLPAAEGLGRATIICTDKTGTLTEEELRVDEIYSGGKKYSLSSLNKSDNNLDRVIQIGLLCNNARDEEDSILGDPTEVALINLGKKLGYMKINLTEENPRLKEFAFDSDRKMASIIRSQGNIKTSYVKGAPNIILSRCTKEYSNGKISLIDKKRKVELEKAFIEMEGRGLRVLGLAFRQINILDQKNAENNLILSGFVGMIDPPRKEVHNAIKEAISAGIEIKIITGDSALTTMAIANQIGLKGDYITGEDLEKLPEEEWSRVVKTKTIFARVTPSQKLKIVETLKGLREIVAVTGDGVNDVLALKRADVGISMGIRGSDVSRDSSDIVLLDDNFASIVGAIRQGRRVFDNIKKSIMFLLAINAANIFIIIWSIFKGLPLPFLPLAILWMNIITDSLPALALAVEPEEKNIMSRGPKKEGIMSEIGGTILIAGIINFILVIWMYSRTLELYGLEIARTMAITVSVFFAMFFIFSCKSNESLFKTGIFNNKWIIYTVIISTAIHLTAIYTGFGSLFGFVPLSNQQLWTTIVWGLTPLVFFEAKKLIDSWFKENKKSQLNNGKNKV